MCSNFRKIKINIRKILWLFLIITVIQESIIFASQNNADVSEKSNFWIVKNEVSVPIFYDSNDAEVVKISAEALSQDIKLITDISPKLITNQQTNFDASIIVGTIGKSKQIDEIIKTGKFSVNEIKGKWESFIIQIVNEPIKGIKKSLIICGSDPRGTAFGIFELSKRLGISPWVYWADVIPSKKKNLNITINKIIIGPPSVKYRGIFLNDEDWGLQPWAAQNVDTDISDIGPKTYTKIFELMLRLKANYIWPAMHPCTKAFFYYKENMEVAKKYDIVLGSSHAEPMLRNNVDEWKNNFVKEYGKNPGDWNYLNNEIEIKKYWEDRVKEVADNNIDAVFTVGMRGIHDSGMPGPKTLEGKVELLDKVITDQRDLLSKHYGKSADNISQIFCPYKEVLNIYNAGAKIPDDITIVWADDNYGYIRGLSNPKEQLRKGGSGVYYHLSYWGSPEDYLWLSSTSPSLISYEMTKAYAYGANRLWIFNVGDIKPAEMDIEFAMDLAWNVNEWKPEKAENYFEDWAGRTFGKDYAKEIAEIKKDYYKLAASGKPEQIDQIKFSKNEFIKRIRSYQEISQKAEDLKNRIPKNLQDAYFELVLYPELGAANMNEKYFYAQIGDSIKSIEAFQKIKTLTDIYNNKIADGKWNGIMSMNPRNRPVFEMPKIVNKKSMNEYSNSNYNPVKTISVDELNFDKTKLQIINGLGVDGKSISWNKFNSASLSEKNIDEAPSVSANIELPKGTRKIELICVPTHAVYEGRKLRTAIQVENKLIKIVDVNTQSQTDEWSKNVIRGYSSAEAEFMLARNKMVNLKLSLLDPGLAISKIIIY